MKLSRPSGAAWLALFFVIATRGPVADAELVVDHLGQSFSFDFEDYSGTGFAPGGGSGRLDSNLFTVEFFGADTDVATSPGENVGSGLFGRGVSSGSADVDGLYAFETGGGNRALGFHSATREYVSIIPEIQLRNQTGQTIDRILVDYDVWVLNDSDSTDYFDFELSDDSNFADPILFDTPGVADASPQWVKTEYRGEEILLPLSVPSFDPFGAPESIDPIANGETLELKWVFGPGSAPSDKVAIDNIRITATSTAIPEPGPVGFALLVAGLVVYRRRQVRD